MEWDGIECEVSYRRVKYARVELKSGKLFLILPPGNDPKVLLRKHRNWIIEKKRFFDECQRDSVDKQIPNRTEAEFEELALALVSKFSQELGVTVNKISFKHLKSKWGSCLPKKRNITLNYTVRYLSDQLLEYIVFHEVAHIVARRHDRRFWELVAGKFSGYREFEKGLVSYQFKIEKLSLSGMKGRGKNISGPDPELKVISQDPGL